MEEENFIEIRTVEPKPESPYKRLVHGILIGFFFCLSICGIFQQLQSYLDPDDPLHLFFVSIASKYWFQISWWFWILLLATSTISFFVIKHRLNKK